MYKNILLVAAVILNLFFMSGCFFEDAFTKNLPAKNIELSRYLGTWYEIARLPAWFEKDLVGVTATYKLKSDGEIEVRNIGYQNTLAGEKKASVGRAWIPDKAQSGRLKVSFFWPIAADYVVLDVDDQYQYALVGSGEDYLWILSRKPQLDHVVYQRLLAKASALGYDLSKIEKPEQSKQ